MASSKPQAFPYDHLFKLLMIGDAAVGKVRARWLPGSLEGIVSFTDSKALSTTNAAFICRMIRLATTTILNFGIQIGIGWDGAIETCLELAASKMR